MLPIKHSTIFKSRWWALAWAAGIVWTAIDVANGSMPDGNASENASAPKAGTAADPDAAQMQLLLNAVS